MSVIPLDMSSSSQTVSDGLAAFFSTEKVPEWRCDSCNRRTGGEKTYRIWRFPTTLLVMLKRFSNDGKKNNAEVCVNEDVDLEEYVVGPHSNCGCEYVLTAFICHFGRSAQSGHYVAFCRSSSSSSSWVCYDDDRVSIFGRDAVSRFSSNVYVMMYEKRT
jgi:uncharacterized UBP type Zn finger protein